MKRESRKRRVDVKLGSLGMILSAGMVFAAHYTDLRRVEPIHGDPTAGATKATVCLACHGPNGNSIIPMFPRLAGQRMNYLYWRLVAFKRYGPSSSPMSPLVRDLTDADMRNLAAYFAAQVPAANGSASQQGGSGKDLYLRGDPARGIPPCQGCHGADAEGPAMTSGQYAAYPALRGQQSLYVAARLTEFRNGLPQRTTNDYIMHGVARTLDDESIQAIANFIGSLMAGDAR